MLETTEKRENGNKAELVRGCVINNSRPAPSIAHTSDLEMLFVEKELLWENPDDSSRV